MAGTGLAEGAGSFPQLIQSLEQLGFFTGLLPFVITYTIFFFMLRKVGSELFDDGREDMFAAILSIAFAFFTSRFILSNPAYQDFFTQYLGRFTVLVVGLLGLLVILGFMGIELEKMDTGIWGGILALFIVGTFSVSGGLGASFLPASSQNQILGAIISALNYSIETGIIFVFLIIGLLYWTMKDPSDNGSDGTGFLAKAFSNVLEEEGSDGGDS